MTETTWETPQYFFDNLNKEFNFTLDVSASHENAKCENYFTKEDDGLTKDWGNNTFFMNPPYGRGQNVYLWVKKAYEASLKGATGVCLLPTSANTKWFHDFCMKGSEIRFVKDRLWFSLNGKSSRANHASMIVIFKGYQYLSPKISTIANCRSKTP